MKICSEMSTVFSLVQNREAKAHSSPKNIAEVISGFGGIISAKVNCAGSRVSVQVMTVSHIFKFTSYPF